jgi:predicted nuclease of restriction endonuclease-like (RecB) superfamily
MVSNKTKTGVNFKLLVNSIKQTHGALQQSAVNAINLSLSVRNWLIGYYIVEYEQKGADRAKYGERLLEMLAKKLDDKSLSKGNLKLFRQFYVHYPQIGQTVSAQLKQMAFSSTQIGQSLTGQLKSAGKSQRLIGQSMTGQLKLPPPIAEIKNSKKQSGAILQTVSAEFITPDLMVPPDKLISKLSFTHLTELFPVTDPLKRTFYEMECIKGNWSVRQLRRQINSLYYERSGMSKNPAKLSMLLAKDAEAQQPADVVKSVYAFEFLGLKNREVVEESDLETALLDHLQEFFLEMGHGFCLEGRQKKILIGNQHYFIDLVFYHRILKCHILLDLKTDGFNHINAGQLNSYIGYYKNEVMRKDDNPPVGILLVTDKNDALVQYATAGMDKRLFVSKYLVELPGKQELEDFVRLELKKL